MECRILWKHDDGISCDFSDLFEQNDKVKLLSEKRSLEILEAMDNYNRILFRLKNWVTKDFKLVRDGRRVQSNHVLTPKVIWASTYSTICVHSWSEFGLNQEYFSFLEPVGSVSKEIDRIDTHHRLDQCIGIHIRGTDNALSKANSPPFIFENVISDLIKKDGKSKFYLVTDEPLLGTRLSELFKPNLIFYPRPQNRNTIEGVQGALIDLYCLSRTKRVLGSYYSSFSRVASEIGKKQLDVIRL